MFWLVRHLAVLAVNLVSSCGLPVVEKDAVKPLELDRTWSPNTKYWPNIT